MYILEAGTHYMYNIYSYADYAYEGKHIFQCKSISEIIIVSKLKQKSKQNIPSKY